MAISIFYLTLFILSMVAEYLLLRNKAPRKSSYYVILFTLISVVCLAYIAYSTSLDTGMALVANQFSYLDGTFVMMFFIFCIFDICKIRVTRWIAIPMTAIGMFFLCLAFTIGYNRLFYSYYTYNTYAGSAHLITELGPVYIFYVTYVIFTVLTPIGILIYSAFQKRKISYKYIAALGLLMLIIVLMYFVQNGLGLGFDILPAGYVLMEYVILAVIHRIGLYDISSMALEVTENNREYGCIIFDNKHHFVGANETARFYFPELQDLEIDREVSNEWVKTEFVNWIEVFDTGNVSSKRYERKEHSLRCSMKKYSLSESSRSYGYAIEIWDDTEEHNFIQKLNSMNEELEAAVASANEANEAKSRFLASMSHEIRTPINAILGMNEIALRECEDDTLISYMQDIHNAGENLLSIINDILDFSKIEAGKIDIIEDKYELAKFIKDIVDLIEIKAKDKGLKLVVNADEKLPTAVWGDVNRMRQIMINLLNNAVKYTHEGTVELNIRMLESNGVTGTFEFSVKDTGIGIKDTDTGVLFDRFSRVDEEKNKSIEGTGLGLAITKRLVDIMGGEIKVESEYGTGSTFTVVMPQKIIDDSPMGRYNIRKKVAKNDVKHIDATGINILVVDDVQMNLTVVKGLLKPTKARVVTCKSGIDSLELMKNQHFDMVMMDHMMPEMDGIEVLKLAKASKDINLTDVVFIALTANAISGIKDMYLEAGFDDYLSKPVNPDEMEAMIEKYCLQD